MRGVHGRWLLYAGESAKQAAKHLAGAFPDFQWCGLQVASVALLEFSATATRARVIVPDLIRIDHTVSERILPNESEALSPTRML